MREVRALNSLIRRYKTNDDEAGAVSEQEKLTSGKWELSETGDLTISNLDKHDGGKYSCFGEDETDNIVSSSDVVVNCKFVDRLNYFARFHTLQISVKQMSGWLDLVDQTIKYRYSSHPRFCWMIGYCCLSIR
jgi:hypothetical protein